MTPLSTRQVHAVRLMLLRHQGAAVAVLAFVVPWNARPLPWNVSGAHRRPFLGVMATEPPAELYDALARVLNGMDDVSVSPRTGASVS